MIQGAPALDLVYVRHTLKGTFTLDTREIRAQLGPEVSLSEPEIALWIRDYIREQEQEIT